MTATRYVLIYFILFFLLATIGAHLVFDTGKTRIDFEIALHQVHGEAKGEFFIDTGEGFNEFETIKFFYNQKVDGRFKQYSMYLPCRKIIRALRFDPLPKWGVLSIKNVVVQKDNNPSLLFDPLQNPPLPLNGILLADASEHGVTITMDQDDPYMLLLDNLEPYTANSAQWFAGFSGLSCFLLFLVIAGCSASFAVAGVFFQKQLQKPSILPPHKAFSCLALVFGITLVIVNPPFQVPDEPSHYYRIYQLSEGTVKAEKRSEFELGGELPAAVTMMPVRFDNHLLESASVMTLAGMKQMLALSVDPEVRLFMPFGNTTVYSPVSYFPQVAGMLLGKYFEVSALSLLYLGRILNLLVWVLLVAAAIHITPVAKWLMLALALLPMGLYEAASLSADAVTNGLSYLLIALTLRYRFIERSLFLREKSLYFLLTVTLMLSKFAYLPLVLLVGLIPPEKLGGKKSFIVFSASLVVFSLFAVLGWIWYISDIHVAFSPDNCADPHAQLQCILLRPLQFVEVLLNTLSENRSDLFFLQFIGILAHLTLKLPDWVYTSSIAVLAYLAFHVEREKMYLNLRDRILLIIMVVTTVLLISTVVYMNFNAPGAHRIVGLQGRYFIPLGPLFFLLFQSKRLLCFSTGRQSLFLAYQSLVLATTIFTILDHYYLFRF